MEDVLRQILDCMLHTSTHWVTGDNTSEQVNHKEYAFFQSDFVEPPFWQILPSYAPSVSKAAASTAMNPYAEEFVPDEEDYCRVST